MGLILEIPLKFDAESRIHLRSQDILGTLGPCLFYQEVP